jgi:hypothetical protein
MDVAKRALEDINIICEPLKGKISISLPQKNAIYEPPSLKGKKHNGGVAKTTILSVPQTERLILNDITKKDFEIDIPMPQFFRKNVDVQRILMPVKSVLIVDVENLPKFIDEYNGQNFQNFDVEIFAFVGKYHCLSTKKFPENVKKILSPSTRADGTDTCIQVFVGIMLCKEVYDYYFIATLDHFGSALVDMICSKNLV